MQTPLSHRRFDAPLPDKGERAATTVNSTRPCQAGCRCRRCKAVRPRVVTKAGP